MGMSILLQLFIFDNITTNFQGSTHVMTELILLPRELLDNEIVPLLGLTELVSLKLCCRSMYYLDIHLILLTNIEKKIQETFGESTNLFYDFLQITGAAISGSWLVQIIRNEYFPCSDIDIIVPLRTSNSCEGMIIPQISDDHEIPLNNSLRLIHNLVEVLGGELRETTHDGDPNYHFANYHYIPELNGVYEMSWEPIVEYEPDWPLSRYEYPDKLPLNFITTELTIPDHIESYDLTLVKKHYTRNNDIGILKITDLPAISNKWLTVVKPTNKYLNRLNRYIDRGYKIYSKHKDDDIILLDEILIHQRPIRGEINAITHDDPKLEGNRLECNSHLNCPLDYFVRSYSHRHLVKGVVPDDELRRLCSRIIIDL